MDSDPVEDWEVEVEAEESLAVDSGAVSANRDVAAEDHRTALVYEDPDAV